MDIVIPLGSDSKWKNNELRYCLRGLEKHCKDLGKIVIVGEQPDWLNMNEITYIPVKDTHTATFNIWSKTKAAAESREVSANFLFCNDDYFFQSDFTIKGYPFYYTDVTGNSPYKKILRRTLDVCERSGLPALNYDVHKPMIVNKKQFLKTWNYFEWHLPIDMGLVMKSCYANLAGVRGEWCQDIKLTQGCDIPDTGMFSISDDIIDPSFKYYCSERWPNKSKYEN